MTSSTKNFISDKVSSLFNSESSIEFTAVGGGSINETYKVSSGEKSIFCKVNSTSEFPQLFQKEKNGLELLKQQNVIIVPSVIDTFSTEFEQILLMEWIYEGERTKNFWKNFGKNLASLHHINVEHFGLHEDNYMGSVKQSNTKHSNWITFFRNERLQPLVEQCIQKKLLQRYHVQQFENLYSRLQYVFNIQERPSLLHGDLWSGNFMCSEKSEAVLIDPAVYYGHRSVDLAMTTLFGGFNKSFYEAYNHYFPFPDNYEEQWKICNLYPLLIHLLLFGSSYLRGIEATLQIFQ